MDNCGVIVYEMDAQLQRDSCAMTYSAYRQFAATTPLLRNTNGTEGPKFNCFSYGRPKKTAEVLWNSCVV